MKFIRPKPISKTNKLIPKSYVVVKSSFAHLVPFSKRSHSVCGQVQIVTLYNVTLWSRDSKKLKGAFGKKKISMQQSKTQRL